LPAVPDQTADTALAAFLDGSPPIRVRTYGEDAFAGVMGGYRVRLSGRHRTLGAGMMMPMTTYRKADAA
jgi:hypothetical protein